MKRLRPTARWTGLVLALLTAVGSSRCAAGPLVLRGTATVATAAHALNPDLSTHSPLPLDVAVGDTFDFDLSIDTANSQDDPPGYSGTFSAHIGGVDVVDDGLLVRVFNDALIYPQHIAKFIVIDATEAYGDQIRTWSLRHSGHVLPGEAPAFYTTLYFTSLLDFEPQHSALLLDAQLPHDTATWQSFSQRELSLSFLNRTYLGAYITTRAVVPEPSALSLVAALALVLSRRRWW